jgi:ATP-dependent DNA ligase
LSRREAARTAILYAFDLIEHDGEDLRARRRGRGCCSTPKRASC